MFAKGSPIKNDTQLHVDLMIAWSRPGKRTVQGDLSCAFVGHRKQFGKNRDGAIHPSDMKGMAISSRGSFLSYPSSFILSQLMREKEMAERRGWKGRPLSITMLSFPLTCFIGVRETIYD